MFSYTAFHLTMMDIVSAQAGVHPPRLEAVIDPCLGVKVGAPVLDGLLAVFTNFFYKYIPIIIGVLFILGLIATVVSNKGGGDFFKKAAIGFFGLAALGAIVPIFGSIGPKPSC